MSPTERERRRHVRMCPVPELPAVVQVKSGGQSREALVHDISLGGIGVYLTDAFADLESGATFEMTLDLGPHGKHALTGRVRHVGRDEPGVLGTEFVALEGDAYSAVKRYVAELLERGAPS